MASSSLDAKLADVFNQLSVAPVQSTSAAESHVLHSLSRIATSGFLGDGRTKICRRSSITRLLRPILIDGICLQLFVNNRFILSNTQNVKDMVAGQCRRFEYFHRRLNAAVLVKALFYFISRGHKAVVWLPAVYNTREFGICDIPDLLQELAGCGLLRFFDGEDFNEMLQASIASDGLVVTRVLTWDRGSADIRQDNLLKEFLQKTEESGLNTEEIRKSFVQPCYYRQEQYFSTPFLEKRDVGFAKEAREDSAEFAPLMQEQLTLHQQLEYTKIFKKLVNAHGLLLNFAEETALNGLIECTLEN